MSIRTKLLKNLIVCIWSFSIIFTACAALNLRGSDLYAETAVFSKSVRMVKNREVTEMITAKNSKDELLANAKIAITIDDPGKVSIHLKDPTINDQVNEDGTVLSAKTDANGQKTFIIKGLMDGTTAIHFEISQDGADKSNTFMEIVTVTVIELKIEYKDSW